MKKGTTHLINLKVNGDNRGSLIALEENSSVVPFFVKRVYYIYGTLPDVVRGKHAHKTLKQVLVCVSGACDIECFDGQHRQTITLNNPSQGLYLEGLIWREMKNFTPDCVLMVLASDHYNEADYIRDYTEFLKENFSNW